MSDLAKLLDDLRQNHQGVYNPLIIEKLQSLLPSLVTKCLPIELNITNVPNALGVLRLIESLAKGDCVPRSIDIFTSIEKKEKDSNVMFYSPVPYLYHLLKLIPNQSWYPYYSILLNTISSLITILSMNKNAFSHFLEGSIQVLYDLSYITLSYNSQSFSPLSFISFISLSQHYICQLSPHPCSLPCCITPPQSCSQHPLPNSYLLIYCLNDYDQTICLFSLYLQIFSNILITSFPFFFNYQHRFCFILTHHLTPSSNMVSKTISFFSSFMEHQQLSLYYHHQIFLVSLSLLSQHFPISGPLSLLSLFSRFISLLLSSLSYDQYLLLYPVYIEHLPYYLSSNSLPTLSNTLISFFLSIVQQIPSSIIHLSILYPYLSSQSLSYTTISTLSSIFSLLPSYLLSDSILSFPNYHNLLSDDSSHSLPKTKKTKYLFNNDILSQFYPSFRRLFTHCLESSFTDITSLSYFFSIITITLSSPSLLNHFIPLLSHTLSQIVSLLPENTLISVVFSFFIDPLISSNYHFFSSLLPSLFSIISYPWFHQQDWPISLQLQSLHILSLYAFNQPDLEYQIISSILSSSIHSSSLRSMSLHSLYYIISRLPMNQRLSYFTLFSECFKKEMNEIGYSLSLSFDSNSISTAYLSSSNLSLLIDISRLIGKMACILSHPPQPLYYQQHDGDIKLSICLFSNTSLNNQKMIKDTSFISFSIFSPFMSLFSPSFPLSIHYHMTFSFFILLSHLKESDIISNSSLFPQCLSLFTSPHLSIRQQSIKGWQYCLSHHLFLSSLITGSPDSSVDQIINLFISSYSWDTISPILSSSLLEIVGSLGYLYQKPNDFQASTMSPYHGHHLILYHLLVFLNHENVLLRSTAFQQLSHISHSLSLSLPTLLSSHSFSLYPLLLHQIVDSPGLIEEICQSILQCETNDFLNLSLRFSLSYLISSHNLIALEEISKRLNTSLFDLCKYYAPYILVDIFSQTHHIQQKPANISNEFDMLLSYPSLQWLFDNIFSHYQLDDLIQFSLPKMVPELVMRLGYPSYHQKCLSILFWLSSLDNKHSLSTSSKNEAITTADNKKILISSLHTLSFSRNDFSEFESYRLSEFLADHALGVLDRFTTVLKISSLSSHTVTSEFSSLSPIDRLNYDFDSLRQFISLAKHHLSNFAPTLLALLKPLLSHPHRHQSLITWDVFIRSLPLFYLSSCLSQIIVSLLPYSENEDCKDIIQSIWDYFYENKNSLKDNIEFYLILPPSLQPHYTILERMTKLLHALDHESWNVRRNALQELHDVLYQNYSLVESQVLDSPHHPLLNLLFSSLLPRCSDKDSDNRNLAIKCLGVIGAIDPADIDVRTISVHESNSEKKINRIASISPSSTYNQLNSFPLLTNDQLVITLIEDYLSPFLLASSTTQFHNRVLFSIQHLLREYFHCNDTTPDRFQKNQQMRVSTSISSSTDRRIDLDVKAWSLFSDDVKDLITPCLSSQYVLLNEKKSINMEVCYHPSMSMRAWLAAWTRLLEYRSSQYQYNNPNSQSTSSISPRASIFHACLGVLKSDKDLAQFLLPYFIHDALYYGEEIDSELIQKELISVLETSTDFPHNIECKQVVFELIDRISQWSRLPPTSPNHNQNLPLQPIPQSNHQLKQLNYYDIHLFDRLLSAISGPLLAHAAYQSHAYPRALKYFETYLHEECSLVFPSSKFKLKAYPLHYDSQDLHFLQEIYSHIPEGEGDLIIGLSQIRNHQTSFTEMIRDYENENRYSEALSGYEQGLQTNPDSSEMNIGILKSLSHLGHLQAVITQAQGLIALSSNKDNSHQLISKYAIYGVQASWRLGHLDSLLSFLSYKPSHVFEVKIGKIISSLLQGHQKVALDLITQTRHSLSQTLSAACRESYQRAFVSLCQISLLEEIEEVIKNDTTHLQAWDGRLRRLPKSLSVRQQFFDLRRVVYQHMKQPTNYFKNWLKMAKIARRDHQYFIAQSALLQLSNISSPLSSSLYPLILYQQAKLQRCQSQNTLAIQTLHRTLKILDSPSRSDISHNTSPIFSSSSSISLSQSLDSHQIEEELHWLKAKIFLRLALYHQEDGTKTAHDIIAFYNCLFLSFFFIIIASIINANNGPFYLLSKIYCHLGKYLDELFERCVLKKMKIRELEEQGFKSVEEVFRQYITSLHHGHKYIFDILPRLLTLWFDIHENQNNLAVFNELNNWQQTIPPYQWMTVLPQIISRLCHPSRKIFQFITDIITNILKYYPLQASWYVIPVTKCQNQSRQRRAIAILNNANKHLPSSSLILLEEQKKLIDQFILICEKDMKSLPRTKTILLPERLLNLCPTSQIIPLQQNLNVNLTYSDLAMAPELAYSSQPLTIASFAPQISILKSKEKPKKMGIIGSDGNIYWFLCKKETQGDMRKDSRLMEFNALVNRLLDQDPESRRRRLRIRTFAVLPLTESDGIIEWVPYTTCFRSLVQKIEKENGIHYELTSLRNLLNIKEKSNSEIKENFLTILKNIPPVFHKWFLLQYPDPFTWFEKRMHYTESVACWSMIGFVVGLGDRHGENILIDESSGESIHVDYDCIFDKGLNLDQPETVPFRLTQNIVDAFGVCGIEGVFRRSCEIVLSLLRCNNRMLLNILYTFIHDPLVCWEKERRSGEVSMKSNDILFRVEIRLRGQIKSDSTIPFSVRGQVDQLISTAMDNYNLSRMYIGWMPFL